MGNPYREVDSQILGNIYSSSEPMENLTILCDEYGSRTAGSGDRGACEYMKSKFEEYGLENIRLEEFELEGWTRGPAFLEVKSPIQKEIPCISLPYNLAGEVEAKLVDLGDGAPDIYEKRRDEIEGNIVMVTSRNMIKGARTRMHRKIKYFSSVFSGAAAFIFQNHYPAYGPATGGVEPIIPAISVPYEEGEFLKRLLRRKGEIFLRLETTDKISPMKSWNPVAELPGNGNYEKHVLVGAHYDGHDIAQGAIDSGSGAVVVMEMARVLAGLGEHLKRKITFTCFSMEETGGNGAIDYVERHKDELDDLRIMMNFDAAGGPGRKGFNLYDWDRLIPFFKKIRSDTLADMPIYSLSSGSRALGSDQKWFFLEGIPTTGMGDPQGTAKKGGRGFGHTMYDTLDKVDIRDIWEASSNGARAILRISNEDDWPIKQRRPKEEIKRILTNTEDIERLVLEKQVAEIMEKRGLKVRKHQKILTQVYNEIVRLN